ncbi:MAG: DMT family transporter [Alphaproteobacteria bacterium]|nr:DMT family transporter [Alphaproteobacteria bacterium]
MKTRLSTIAAGLSGNLRGIAWMALSTVAFVTMHAAVRDVSQDMHPFEVAFFRQFFGIVALAPWFIRYGLAPLRTRRLGMHGVRAFVNVIAMFAFYYALSTVPLAQVSALAFSVPIFTALLAMAFLGERARLRRWAAILFGFSGVFVAFIPDMYETGAPQLGSLLVVLSSFTWAIALIFIKVLGRTESTITITAYMVLLMTPMSLLPALAVWEWPTMGQFGWLLFIGVVGTIGQLTVVQALKEGETHVVMPIDFTKLIWAAGLGFLWFGEIPTVFTWAGGAMIFFSTTYIAWREHQLRKAANPPL